MACCKDTQYNLFLKLEPWQKQDTSVHLEIQNGLVAVMKWSKTKAIAAVNHAILTENFQLKQGTAENLTNLSLRLANVKVPHQMKLSKK